MKLTGTGVAASLLSPTMASGAVSSPPVPSDMIEQLGLASYTTRKLTLDETVKWAKNLGLKHVSLKDFHLPLKATDAQFAEVRTKLAEAGLDFYGVGVIYMKSREDVDRAFEYAKKAGVKMIIAAPLHEFLDYTEQKIKEYNIRVAIHNHGPGDLVYPTVESAWEKIKDRDPRFGLCMDIGHTYRIQEDPDVVMKKFKDRMLDIHVKDVTSRGKEGATVEMGRGQIDIAKFLKAVKNAGYKGYLSFEYEKDGEAPIPGLSESVGYIRGVIRSIF
jgi:sugar phosphate isomerase/epimerase